jgi:rod shape-determining protein MreD
MYTRAFITAVAGKPRKPATCSIVLCSGVVAVAMLLQTLVASHVTILGISIDLFLIFTVIVALCWGSLAGAVFGFVAGIAADIAYFEPLGMHAFVYVVTGYSLGLLTLRFGTRSLWMVLFYTLGASFVAKVIFGAFAYVMGPQEGFFTMLSLQMIPGAALDALVAVPLYLLLLKLRVVSVARSVSGSNRSPVP